MSLVQAVSKIIVVNKSCEIIYKMLGMVNLSSPLLVPGRRHQDALEPLDLTDLVRTPLSY